MTEKRYSHLIKPLLVRDGPEGLYPKPLIWMESKDLEGYNAQFSYTIVTEPCSFHPIEGAVVHTYDELLVFGGTDPRDILFLGAEISIELGEEREEYIFTEPTVITIPKGVIHGPVKVRRVYKPIAHYILALGPEYDGDIIELPQPDPAAPIEHKYAHLVKKMQVYLDDELNADDPLYEMCTDDRGVMSSKLAPPGTIGPGNSDELFWMFGKDLERFDINFVWGHYSMVGKWHRGGETHKHPEEEILVFVGYDPDDLTDLGCEIDMGMGPKAERYIFNKPTAVVCPKGFPHLPEITRWCDKPYAFIVACLSGDHASPWVEVKTD